MTPLVFKNRRKESVLPEPETQPDSGMPAHPFLDLGTFSLHTRVTSVLPWMYAILPS